MGAAPSVQAKRDLDHLDFYEVLEVHKLASSEEIKKAYHKQCREHHPDKNLNDPDATRRFTKVLAAYQTLTDYEKRAAYDFSLTEEKKKEFKAPPSSGDVPGSWKFNDKNGRENPYYWLFALFACLSPILKWIINWWSFPAPSFHVRFRFEAYVKSAYNRDFFEDPGLSTRDIEDFCKIVAEMGVFAMDDDHSDQGLFSIVENFFLCVAFDERRWGSGKNFPRFGCAHSIWSRKDWVHDPRVIGFPPQLHEMQDFYTFWSEFRTLKSFDWVEPYDIHLGEEQQAAHEKRKANKLIRDEARRNYNTSIQVLTSILLRLDPRYMIHLYLVEERRGTASNTNAATSTSRPPNSNNKKKHRNRRRK